MSIKITPELLREMSSCYSDEEHAQIFAAHDCTEATPLEVAAWDDVPVDARVWVLLHEPFLSVESLRRLALSFAQHVLPIWQNAYPDDTTVELLLDVTKKYLDGNSTLGELNIAQQASTWATREAASQTSTWATRASTWAAWAARAASRNAVTQAATWASRAASWASPNAAWQLDEIVAKMTTITTSTAVR